MKTIWNMKHKKTIAAVSTAMACALLGICAVVLPDNKKTEADTAIASIEAENTESAAAEVEEVSNDIVKKAVEETTTAKKVEEKATEETTTKKEYNGAYKNKFMVNLNSEYLNIRAKADANAEVIGKLYVGAGGDVLKKGKNWTKISSGTVKGYVSTEYLLFDEDAEKKAKECGTLVVTITADSLRVRKEPSTEAGIYGTVANGETYTGLGKKNGFIAISFEGNDGYISADYVTTELTINKAVSIEEEQEAIRQEQERLEQERLENERKAQEEADAIAKATAESKFVETVKGSAYNVSEEDAYLLACVVAAESGYECYEGQLAVANIVLNRLKSGVFGSTMKDVLYASGQFTVVSSQRFADVRTNGPNETSIKAAKDALSGTNNVPGFTSFCASWAANYSRYTEYTIVGNQVFYR